MLPPGESHEYADGTDRQTDKRTDTSYITLSAMDVASVISSNRKIASEVFYNPK